MRSVADRVISGRVNDGQNCPKMDDYDSWSMNQSKRFMRMKLDRQIGKVDGHNRILDAQNKRSKRLKNEREATKMDDH